MMETRRLILRQFQKKDWQDVLEYGSQEQVAKRANFTPLRTKRDAFSFERVLFRDGVLALEEKSSAKVIGNIGAFEIIKADGLVEKNGREVGYALNQDFWGQGFMTEALAALCNLERSKKTSFLQARVYADNLASQKVLQKNGFKFQGDREVFDVFQSNKKILELFYVKMLVQKEERF